MINLCLVVIATQFSETKKREMERMKMERARFHSTSTLTSSTNNSEPSSCYAQMVKWVLRFFFLDSRFHHLVTYLYKSLYSEYRVHNIHSALFSVYAFNRFRYRITAFVFARVIPYSGSSCNSINTAIPLSIRSAVRFVCTVQTTIDCSKRTFQCYWNSMKKKWKKPVR